MASALENNLKSWFLTLLVIYNVIVTAIGAAVLASDTGDFSIWLSVTIASAQVAFYFAWLYLAHVPRTSPGLAGFSIGIFLATMYSVYASYAQQLASVAPLLGFVSLSGWLAYVAWYSDLGDRSSAKIKVGKKLPAISLEDYDGKRVSSEDWTGERRLVIFYRGNWCPICTAQVKELEKLKTRFDELGVKITFISPQAHHKSRNFAMRMGSGYDFLVDVNNSAAKVLGILHSDGLPKGLEILGYEPDVPMPTTFVVDEKGKVLFADLSANYRLRPRPEDILAAIRP